MSPQEEQMPKTEIFTKILHKKTPLLAIPLTTKTKEEEKMKQLARTFTRINWAEMTLT